ncbi:MAG: hypothetical protein IPO64_02565 [Bacteroidetes bacterium]|nr:hypothetical protein [Bacteroidota bacterium]
MVNYYNIEVNALGGNYEATPLGAGGNLNLNSSFVLQGTMNVNSPAVLRMDEFDFIYKHDLTALSTVNINAGAGLLYGSQYGITTVGTANGIQQRDAGVTAGNINY